MINISDPGHLPVLALFGLVVFVVFPLIVLSSNEAKPIAYLQSKLGLDAIWAPVLLIGAALWAIVFGLLVVGLLSVIWEIFQGVHWKSTASDMSNSGRFALVRLTAITATTGAVIAFPLTLIKVKLTRDANNTTVQGQITDRINKAVEGLGAEKTPGSDETKLPRPNIEVRIGSILALERIAQETLDFHIQVMEILCAYVRENAPKDLDPAPEKPRADVQLALTVIGRRTQPQKDLERKTYVPGSNVGYRLDLSHCWLNRIQLTKSDFEYAVLSWSSLKFANLAGAKFGHTDLTKTNLRSAILDQTGFNKSELNNADLTNALARAATFHHTELDNAVLANAFLHQAQFVGSQILDDDVLESRNVGEACFWRVDLWAVDSNQQYRDRISEVFADGTVEIAEGAKRPSHWPEAKLDQETFLQEYQKWLADPDNYTPPPAP
ncbi:pentapeptide repeat-containing protein [Phaeobacter italicus]|uniref:pentapeptide repeat-containing protein n=1 Tax=Phaeobacter italicus TaxID=481446 RepID=UPI001CD37B8B|nr:pentapeptide repeat-containing protein [Phaeobacter italicus]MCA0855837.1 pentapeptide repeat-containing protein [Phaeobacter italicus]